MFGFGKKKRVLPEGTGSNIGSNFGRNTNLIPDDSNSLKVAAGRSNLRRENEGKQSNQLMERVKVGSRKLVGELGKVQAHYKEKDYSSMGITGFTNAGNPTLHSISTKAPVKRKPKLFDPIGGYSSFSREV